MNEWNFYRAIAEYFCACRGIVSTLAQPKCNLNQSTCIEVVDGIVSEMDGVIDRLFQYEKRWRNVYAETLGEGNGVSKGRNVGMVAGEGGENGRTPDHDSVSSG